ncbi:50S ribosomal protein L10 [Chamaesiphon sp. VAR_69_metabat_338]|uniref:50S ribosomal protein L10 n=1 Tax=Chamaesiphon sp. VAR_69_metabat_338 TaxID=2964704 RepID=UPI00286EAD30|nr:50S ribosomal protein L10 [Chamaesiphon sp. VAR_69_metabat_338]
MGRTRANKETIVAALKQELSEATMVAVINYQGLTVAEITDLRRRIRPKGGLCTVTKNTLMGKAIEGNTDWQALAPLLKGSSAFLLLKDDIGGSIKAYQDFQKASKKTELNGGVMEGKALTGADVKAIGDLPSKEQLMAQIAGALNSVTAKIAIGVKEVPASIARSLQAHVDKG